MYKTASRNMQHRAERDKPEQLRPKERQKLRRQRRRKAKMHADALAVKDGRLSFANFVRKW